MKGRKPKLTLVEGGTAKSVKLPAAPSWLGDIGQAEWRLQVRAMIDRGLWRPEMATILGSYCAAVQQVRECQTKIDADGLVLTADNGMQMKNPAVPIMHAAQREMRLLSAELAIGPHRQAKAADDGKSKSDGWDSDLLA